MTVPVNQIERITQNRVVKFFKEKLGYDYLGNWQDRSNNSNIEEEYLTAFLKKQGYDEAIIKKAIVELIKTATNQQKSLYDKNKDVYELLKYGVSIKPGPSEQSVRVYFIDWNNQQKNHFAIAEEVTVTGQHTKRPDIVIYINGIAVGVIELKRSRVSISEGIRQNLDNQKKVFIQDFFSTMQLVMAGNDTQGLKYGTIETPERYYMEWKEENPEFAHNKKQYIPRTLPKSSCEISSNMLDCDIYRLLNKERLLEIIHDFIVFDAGIKKVPRHNQYFGVKAAQKSIGQREGGIIWHSQGSGKSLTMVWLAKWILSHNSDARILIITDREELDEQIEKVFKGVGEKIYRTKSARDLLRRLNKTEERLICSLIHKFGRAEATDKDYSNFLDELKKNLPTNFRAKGDIHVFVDECHRTQSGKLHDAMKLLLPNALLIGFTGTPLLKADKLNTLQRFGKYIHTYKFDEAVNDEVVLDLRYEAKDVDIKVTEQDKIDQWFEAKTKGLTDIAKAQLKQRWGTLKKLYSSQSRMEKIVADIIFDFETKSRLQSGRGNAMLVAGSIYEACKYYEIFRSKGFDKVAIVTSYWPSIEKIKCEETGEEGEAENLKKYEVYKKMISDYFNISEEEAINFPLMDKFEKDVKKKFVEEPAQMKLLIVVDKLLTGFDAPSATYLYIDKPMKDHGLFQAVCRVNRLDDKDKGDDLDKDFGYILDYRDLFNSMEKAISDYTSGAFADFDKEDVEGLIKDRRASAKKRLEEILEQLDLMTEGVKYPRDINEYKDYFIGDNSEEFQHLRLEFYKKVSSLVRTYTDIANELNELEYTEKEQKEIMQKVEYYTALRDNLKLISGDYLDFKVFDPAMRHLIDTYINAEGSKTLATFQDTSILEIIALEGIDGLIKKLPHFIKSNKEAVAETIENNIRKLITDERDVNPLYYEKMSKILEDLVEQRKKEVINYEEYLRRIEKLTKEILRQEDENNPYPESIKDSKAKKAIYDNLVEINNREELTNKIDEAIKQAKQDAWRGNLIRERMIKNAIYNVLKKEELTKKIFKLVIKQEEY